MGKNIHIIGWGSSKPKQGLSIWLWTEEILNTVKTAVANDTNLDSLKDTKVQEFIKTLFWKESQVVYWSDQNTIEVSHWDTTHRIENLKSLKTSIDQLWLRIQDFSSRINKKIEEIEKISISSEGAVKIFWKGSSEQSVLRSEPDSPLKWSKHIEVSHRATHSKIEN